MAPNLLAKLRPSRSRPGDGLEVEEILREEFEHIHGKQAWSSSYEKAIKGHFGSVSEINFARVIAEWTRSKVENEPQLGPWNHTALCLSGGGIRSAAFALGVLQALARLKLLQEFHYLSTVSGGGYIGAWLSAWNHRSQSFDDVNDGLAGTKDAKPLHWLRANQSYLTPQVGLFSPDTWSAVATIFRNIFLNWLVIVPLLFALALLPNLLLIAIKYGISHTKTTWSSLKQLSQLSLPPFGLSYLDSVAAGLVVVFLLAALLFFRPSSQRNGFGDRAFLWLLLGTLGVASLLFTVAIGSWISYSGYPTWAEQWRVWGLLGFIIFSLARFFPTALRDESLSSRAWELGCWGIAGACAGVMNAGGAQLMNIYFRNVPTDENAVEVAAAVLAIMGPSWVLLSFVIADILFTGLMSRPFVHHGQNSRIADEDREWQARCDGWIILIGLTWLVIAGVGLGPQWLYSTSRRLHHNTIFYFILAGSGGLALVGGTGSFSKVVHSGFGQRQLSLTRLVTFMASIFALMGFAVLSAIASVLPKIMEASELPFVPVMECWDVDYCHIPLGEDFAETLIALGVLIIFSFVVSFFININWFSLHALYRNRLVKAFLGASNDATMKNPINGNEKPERNPFTGFSRSDNIPMAKLRTRRGTHEPLRPFHILNLTLNVASSGRLAWQERKAESFTCSPLHVGGAEVKYRGSAYYASGVWPTAQVEANFEDGITLGTAMAISGAAASPNWGYHTSSITSLVMMLFNLRLGWWFGNPSKNSWWCAGPTMSFSLFPREAIARTDDTSNWIYLSDGGHFENLGVYEMVRRRCRLIVVTDAGSDPRFGYADLGNAIRKVYLDLGIRIEIERLFMQPRRRPFSRGTYCAYGIIRYNEGEEGKILYIKPGAYDEDLPADVRAYAASNPRFPHDSTVNQWFGESQFDAYRALGSHAIDTIVREGQKLTDEKAPQTPATLLELFEYTTRYVDRRLKEAGKSRPFAVDLFQNI